MRILVTGHEGFIGQNLTTYLKEHTNWVVDGWEWEINKFPNIEQYDWVIHLGAISSTVEQDVDKIMIQNLEFSQRLYYECCKHNVNLQYASSASVYGLVSNFSEAATASPKNAYAWSKYLFDRWIQAKDLHPIIVQGFRYFNVYGNHEEHKGKQASPVTQFRNQAKTGTIKLFHNSATYLRDFVAVEDVCRIHVTFITDITESSIWNIGTGNTVSFQTVADLIADFTNSAIEYIEMPEILKNSYQTYTCADISKLENTLGKQQWISMKQWLMLH